MTLERESVISIIRRYLDNELSPVDVQRWADVMHVRDDIELQPSYENLLREVLNELANPLLTRSLSPLTAHYWIAKLTKSEQKTS
jgi:hypothetical protein